MNDFLYKIPPDGYVTSEHFKNAGEGRAYRGIRYAYSRGIIKRISPYEHALSLSTVKFWCTQLNESGHKNSTTEHGTKKLYLHGLSKFNTWLPGCPFPSYKTVVSGGQVTWQSITKSFANVEELMEYCHESDHGTKTAQRVIREYVAYIQSDGASASTQIHPVCHKIVLWRP